MKRNPTIELKEKAEEFLGPVEPTHEVMYERPFYEGVIAYRATAGVKSRVVSQYKEGGRYDADFQTGWAYAEKYFQSEKIRKENKHRFLKQVKEVA